MASDILCACYVSDKVDREAVNTLINEIAMLQDEAVSKASFAFDKVKKDFANDAEYNKARHIYNAKAFAALRKEFADKANEIIKKMNEAVPADVRKAISE